MEQNYRSTETILNAANAVIANNSSRVGKNLWTESNIGESIKVYSAYNERDEADFIINRLHEWINQGNARTDSAILYRSNAQSRVLEEGLINAQIPYKIYGGLRFFERSEIKDALAYLRLVSNLDDDSSFERIINKPTRGIGTRTIQIIRDYSRENTCSLWQAAEAIVNHGLSSRAEKSVNDFMELIRRMANEIKNMDLHNKVDHVIQLSMLIDFFKKEKGDKGETRIENLAELVSAAKSFEVDPIEDISPVNKFLSHAALEAGEGQADSWEDCVQLMTMHSVKGLEFPLIFMCGMEDGLFPHQRSTSNPSGLEEERRLCYVGITRAKQLLYITHAEQRRLHGIDNFSQPSRFISEIPSEFIEEIRPRLQTARPLHKNLSKQKMYTENEMDIKLGQRVRHKKFGDGTILNCEGQGASTRVEVNFEQTSGTKWLVLSYANLDLM